MTVAYIGSTSHGTRDDAHVAHHNALADGVNTNETALAALNGGDGLISVIHAPPTTFVKPLMFDDTGSTGGLYAWSGSAYVKVGLATT